MVARGAFTVTRGILLLWVRNVEVVYKLHPTNERLPMQRSIRKSGKIQGTGLHSGRLVTVELCPAPKDSGIVFRRADLPGSPVISASPSSVVDTLLATRVGSGDASVSTVEHFLAACFVLGIDNLSVSVDGPEMPILDGSAVPFLIALEELGVEELQAPRRVMIVRKTLEVVDERDPTRFVRVEPNSTPLLSYAIDFSDVSAIGRQVVTISLTGESVCRELVFARTFCREAEIEVMRARGLALGGSLDNAVVVGRHGLVLNGHGLRAADEFVRHKALDLVGDFTLIGMSVLGHVIANKAGHDLHVRMASQLIRSIDEGSVEIVTVVPDTQIAANICFPKIIPDLPGVLALARVSG